ncbi:16S rRNA (cytosine(1402)-N(4))-methyltransferase RsmH [Nitratifractor salsuginis]|uniref:Ribosomal RNA small subunit methyltransferase H n=1 Tax=Nitratifractor salsuginis (strain DSM 16511 / JCM 12458 / E9I37-1) TaxID=749222 RepID=E6WZP9_NITSE|nr:16S rRNA (cytosine(1402)-N(4))-methyltransferase RsmH [Nitratifractor salsuginis]ADV46690.1 S-adenosyl-methyltransferase MraW [Nitratifractor salsuginis DSM 16511]
MSTHSSKTSLQTPHIPVLLPEVMESFSSLDEGVLIDCTLGYAGHSSALLEAHPKLKLIGIDRDPEALEFSAQRLAPYRDRVRLEHGSFSERLPSLIDQEPVVGILADFGVSSLQLDKKERGFSFASENLDMRMNPEAPLRAYDVVNGYPLERLEYLFREYGEIRPAGALAAAIVKARANAPISSAQELAELAKTVLRGKGKTHPATQMFQAIRIEVNDELGEIERLLDTLEAKRPAGAIVSLITFHSLEDRLVKNRFRAWSQKCICPPEAIRCTCGGNHALGEMLSRKPRSASKEELRSNPRSRSAKLRSFRFYEGADR